MKFKQIIESIISIPTHQIQNLSSQAFLHHNNTL